MRILGDTPTPVAWKAGGEFFDSREQARRHANALGLIARAVPRDGPPNTAAREHRIEVWTRDDGRTLQIESIYHWHERVERAIYLDGSRVSLEQARSAFTMPTPADGWGPSFWGSPRCACGSLASGGDREFCTCSICF